MVWKACSRMAGGWQRSCRRGRGSRPRAASPEGRTWARPPPAVKQSRPSALLRGKSGLAGAVVVHFVDPHGDVVGVHVRGHAVAEVEPVAFALTAVVVAVAVQRLAYGAADRVGCTIQRPRVQVALQRNPAPPATPRSPP